MPSTKREDDIERNYVKHSEQNGRWVPKWVAPGTPGVPDRISISPIDDVVDEIRFQFGDRMQGITDEDMYECAQAIVKRGVKFVELKTAKGRLRPRQKRVHARLRSMGHVVEIVRE